MGITMKQFFRIIFMCVFLMTAFTSCAQQQKYIAYTVKEGETLKSIAKDLNMRTRDLMRLNPSVGRRPAPNTVIMIPNQKGKPIHPKDQVKDSIIVKDSIVDIDELKKTFVVHTVRKGDTFFSLTRFYNVSENELRSLNPALAEGLKVDMILKIKPKKEEDLNQPYTDVIAEDTDISMALLLPFRAEVFDTISAQEIFKTNTLANIATDFYLGAEIAIDSIKKQGVAVDLKVFDTQRKGTAIRNILATQDFSDVDVVIGPLYSEEAIITANEVNAPVVFPVFSKSQSAFRSSRLIKTYADREIHRTALLKHILTKYAQENILIIGDSTEVSIENAEIIRNTLLAHDSIQEAKILHPNNGYIRKDYIINALKAEVGNWVIFATDDNVIAADVINSLISLPTEEEETEEDDKKEKKKDEIEMQILPEDTVIKIFAFDKSTTYDKIDNYKLAKLGFTYTSDVYVDENSEAVKRFNALYEAKNKALPSYYATKGFDITYDVLIRLASGKNLKDTFKEGSSYRVESTFSYSRNLFSSSDNEGLFLLEYTPDLSIKRIE